MKKRFQVFVLLFFMGSPATVTADNIHLFKSKCMICHGVTVTKVYPVDKARIQWERFFRRNVHMPALALDENELRRILTFLHDHAADSDQPMVPGL